MMHSASTAEGGNVGEGGAIHDEKALLGRIFLPDRYDIEGIFLPKKFHNPTFKYKKFLPKK
ncbi:hypothetical protein B6U90_07755 [Thermoplasmatales archaeon ex4484_6]|nr:MAG: hypothetical protein B6U90_07755 [Thermoplasmatales archaeon ex4484_6]